MEVAEFLEGATRLLVPAESLKSEAPPTFPVFFNRAARVNRDVTVSLAAASKAASFCDAMSGVGSRGLRVAKEAPGVERVALVDINRDAMALARRSAGLNRVKGRCEFDLEEASSFLYSCFGKDAKFDWVDLDPFGTPVKQIPAVLSAVADGGVGAVTATDTAVLCGVYPKVAVRRYGGATLNNSFHHESGIRLLLGAIARQGASQELGIEPVAEHATRHYMRVAFRVRVGASRADRSLDSMGYVAACYSCGDVTEGKEAQKSCQSCGGRVRVAGPLWLGPVTDERLVIDAALEGRQRMLDGAAKVLEGLRGVDGFPPWSFDLDGICSRLKVATVSEASVVERLRDVGFSAMKQPFETRGIKTEAPFGEVREAVRVASETNGYQLRKAVG